MGVLDKVLGLDVYAPALAEVCGYTPPPAGRGLAGCVGGLLLSVLFKERVDAGASARIELRIHPEDGRSPYRLRARVSAETRFRLGEKLRARVHREDPTAVLLSRGGAAPVSVMDAEVVEEAGIGAGEVRTE